MRLVELLHAAVPSKATSDGLLAVNPVKAHEALQLCPSLGLPQSVHRAIFETSDPEFQAYLLSLLPPYFADPSLGGVSDRLNKVFYQPTVQRLTTAVMRHLGVLTPSGGADDSIRGVRMRLFQGDVTNVSLRP